MPSSQHSASSAASVTLIPNGKLFSFAPNGKFYVAVTNSNVVGVFDADTHQSLCSFHEHDQKVSYCAVFNNSVNSEQSHYVIVSGQENGFYVWDPLNPQQVSRRPVTIREPKDILKCPHQLHQHLVLYSQEAVYCYRLHEAGIAQTYSTYAPPNIKKTSIKEIITCCAVSDDKHLAAMNPDQPDCMVVGTESGQVYVYPQAAVGWTVLALEGTIAEKNNKVLTCSIIAHFEAGVRVYYIAAGRKNGSISVWRVTLSGSAVTSVSYEMPALHQEEIKQCQLLLKPGNPAGIQLVSATAEAVSLSTVWPRPAALVYSLPAYPLGAVALRQTYPAEEKQIQVYFAEQEFDFALDADMRVLKSWSLHPLQVETQNYAVPVDTLAVNSAAVSYAANGHVTDLLLAEVALRWYAISMPGAAQSRWLRAQSELPETVSSCNAILELTPAKRLQGFVFTTENRIWQWESVAQQPACLIETNAQFTCCAAYRYHDTLYLITGDTQGQLCLWDGTSRHSQPLNRLSFDEPVTACQIGGTVNPDNTFTFWTVAAVAQRLHAWSGAVFELTEPTATKVTCVKIYYIAQAMYIISGHSDGRLRIWQTPDRSRAPLHVLAGFSMEEAAVAEVSTLEIMQCDIPSQAQTFLIAGSIGGHVLVYDIGRGRVSSYHHLAVGAIQFIPQLEYQEGRLSAARVRIVNRDKSIYTLAILREEIARAATCVPSLQQLAVQAAFSAATLPAPAIWNTLHRDIQAYIKLYSNVQPYHRLHRLPDCRRCDMPFIFCDCRQR